MFINAAVIDSRQSAGDIEFNDFACFFKCVKHLVYFQTKSFECKNSIKVNVSSGPYQMCLLSVTSLSH